jgi:hypothetical protein
LKKIKSPVSFLDLGFSIVSYVYIFNNLSVAAKCPVFAAFAKGQAADSLQGPVSSAGHPSLRAPAMAMPRLHHRIYTVYDMNLGDCDINPPV